MPVPTRAWSVFVPPAGQGGRPRTGAAEGRPRGAWRVREGPRDVPAPWRRGGLSRPPGRGARFARRRFLLTPLSFHEAGGMDTPRPRVLIVDNDLDVTRTLALLLHCWGYEPVVAYDGPSALALAAAGPPAAALLDIQIPGMDAFELARRLRDQPGQGKCLLVALTGRGREVDVRRGSEVGISLYFSKTGKPEDLRKALARSCPPAGPDGSAPADTAPPP